jgi:hypothetical protein
MHQLVEQIKICVPRVLPSTAERNERELIYVNHTYGIEFMPVEKRLKHVPPSQDIGKLIEVADPDTQDYLWAVVLIDDSIHLNYFKKYAAMTPEMETRATYENPI